MVNRGPGPGVVSAPLYGEDNLPNPWSNPILVRIQRAMNPVAVADWNANRMSNASGDWPAVIESANHGTRLSRQLSSSTTPSPEPRSTFRGRCIRAPPTVR
jgi:hypothetical protein